MNLLAAFTSATAALRMNRQRRIFLVNMINQLKQERTDTAKSAFSMIVDFQLRALSLRTFEIFIWRKIQNSR
jgi:hypothetical protein